MSTRSGGSKGSGGASTVRESASRRYSTPKGAEKVPTLTASGKRVGRPPTVATANTTANTTASGRREIAQAQAAARAAHERATTLEAEHQRLISQLDSAQAALRSARNSDEYDRFRGGHADQVRAAEKRYNILLDRVQDAGGTAGRARREADQHDQAARDLAERIRFAAALPRASAPPAAAGGGRATPLRAPSTRSPGSKTPATRAQLVQRIARARSDIARFHRNGDTGKRDAAIARHDRLTAQLKQTPA